MPSDDLSPSTSDSLIERLQRDHCDSWQQLTRLYGPVVYDWARQAGLQAEDAADVMQEVFHALTRNISAFRRERAGDSFRGWLWTITRNKVHDHYRRMGRDAMAVGGTDAYRQLMHMPERPPATTSDQSRAERSGVQRRALALMRGDFEHNTWQAFWRTTVHGESADDVAADLGVSRWAVYKARSRVLQRLRAELADLFE